MYLSSVHFSSTSKIDTIIAQNNVFAEGCTSVRLKSVLDSQDLGKIPIISTGLIFVQKDFFAGLIFGEAYFRRGLLLEGILRFKMGWS